MELTDRVLRFLSISFQTLHHETSCETHPGLLNPEALRKVEILCEIKNSKVLYRQKLDNFLFYIFLLELNKSIDSRAYYMNSSEN